MITTKQRNLNKLVRVCIIITTLLLMIGCVFCSDIFTVGEDISKDLFTKIKSLYCDGLFYLLVAIDLLLWAIFAKDDKKSKIFQYALYVIIGVFFAFHLIGVAKNTITDIVSRYDNTTETTIEYTGDANTEYGE